MAAQPSASTNQSEAAAKVEKRRKDAAFVLNNPVFLEVSEPIRKMRSNLLVVSIISIFTLWMGLGISPTLAISGVQLTGLTDTKISTGLAVLTAYMLIHFVWSSWDGFQEWLIRCSGVKVAFSPGPPVDLDPRQASLMTWWTVQVQEVGRQQDSVKYCHALLEKALDPIDPNPKLTDQQARDARYEVVQTFNAYSTGLVQLYKSGVSVANEKNLREQLGRFELVYRRFLVSQNWRWILIEFLVPVVLALVAIALLLTDLNLNPLFSFVIL